MAFGQQAGPPASARQMKDLVALLERAGHVDFRDARGPMGFTQRQAGGRFTRDEAAAFIEQLEEAELESEPGVPELVTGPAPDAVTEPAAGHSAFQGVPTDDLVAELRRRGWTVTQT